MSQKEKNYNDLKQFTLSRGASLFGVADISLKKDQINIYPPEVIKKMDRAVSIGFHLSEAVLKTIIDRPNKIYYRHYKMVNMFLDQLALKVGEEIQRRGYDYFPIPASQVLDWEGLSSHASHRAIARLAGMGWRGKNNLIVNPRFGSMVRYVSILTDLPLKADQPVDGACGACRMCIDTCPAGAITEQGYDLDACHTLLKNFGKTLHVSLICGVCVKVCPGENPLWQKGAKRKNGKNQETSAS